MSNNLKNDQKHKIDLRNGFLRSENLEIVVSHKVLRQIGAKPLQGLKPLAAILDLLQNKPPEGAHKLFAVLF